MRQVLHRSAAVAPEWLQAHSRAAGLERDGRRAEDARGPQRAPQRRASGHTVGLDGDALLDAIDAEGAPAWWRAGPAVKPPRHIGRQPYDRSPEGLRWRTAGGGIPPSTRLLSPPHALEARHAKPDTTSWRGDNVPFTERGEAGEPHPITHVAPTAGPVADGTVTPVIHAARRAKRLWPRRHIVDPGDLAAERLVTTPRDSGVERLGPTRPDDHRQARAGRGVDAGHLRIAWAQQRAVCPLGQQRSRWPPVLDSRPHAGSKLTFSQRDGPACPSRPACTRATRRTLTVRPHAPHLRLQAARGREQTHADRMEYAKRAGIAGPLAHAVRACGVRRARSRGIVNTPLHHVLTAAAITVIRIGSWLAGNRPAQTRLSPFVALMKHATSAA